jgi:hypothetical protein
VEAVPLDDVAHGVGTAEDASLLGLLDEGIQGGASLIGKVACEGPHREGLQDKLRQKFTGVHGPLILVSEQNLFASNFPGATLHVQLPARPTAVVMSRLEAEADEMWKQNP